jgi:hypothetical protein
MSCSLLYFDSLLNCTHFDGINNKKTERFAKSEVHSDHALRKVYHLQLQQQQHQCPGRSLGIIGQDPSINFQVQPVTYRDLSVVLY